MRLVIQRVRNGSVSVDGQIVSEIGPGILCLVGLNKEDTEKDLEWCATRLTGAKLWPDEKQSQWKKSVKDTQQDILLVSQFTLYGRLGKRHRPDFSHAMGTQEAKELYSKFVEIVKSKHQNNKVKDGVFGAYMQVSLQNDGPVTLVIDSQASEPQQQKPAEISSKSAQADLTGDKKAITSSRTQTDDREERQSSDGGPSSFMAGSTGTIGVSAFIFGALLSGVLMRVLIRK